MRRWLALAALCCAALTDPAAAQGTPQGLRAEAVAPDVWLVQGQSAMGTPANRNFISNAGFVVTDAGVVVIDALGSPALATALIAEIRRITPQPIRYLIVTHYHADHIYGLQAFKAAGATILAHQAGRDYLGSDAARQRLQASRQDLAPWIDDQTALIGADRWLDAPETTLRVGAHDIVIRHAGPAHSAEDLVVLVPQRGVLFAGDLVFRGRIPFVGQADSRRWIASLTQLLGLDARIVVPGHGPVSTDPARDLALTRDYLLYLRQSMGAAARELEPFDAAYARTDWSRFERLPLFQAVNRMNAYNTYLLMEQQAEQQAEQPAAPPPR
jgi:glyoxylase-like metal-dependent hydrolase (beta-lactamase superfamily II)